MNSVSESNMQVFTDITKNICMGSTLSILIVILFVISPLSNFIKTSMFMKLVAVLILVYIIVLNIKQISILNGVDLSSSSEQAKTQLNVNIICNYVFTLFIGLLIIFVVKSFFYI